MNLCLLALGLAMLLPISVKAEEAPATAQVDLPQVEILGSRDSEALDIPRSAELTRLFEAISPVERSKIRLSFFARMRNGTPLPSNLQLRLHIGDNAGHRLNLRPSGEVELPLISADEGRSASISANLPKGSLQIVYYVQPSLPTDGPLTLGFLREAMRQARPAWAKLYGPLLGWTVPSFNCIQFHYSTAGTVSLLSAGRGPAWKSERSRIVTLGLDPPEFKDELLVELDSPPPERIGGCVRSDGPPEPNS